MSVLETDQAVIEAFWDFWVACDDPQYTHYISKGGRNSAKSTTISERMIFDLMALPINALCVRKVGETLQESVYEQLKEACNLLGVSNEFEFGKSPLRITYKSRGNYILFRGADKPEKIKSIKTSNFPIARVWFEEITEFKTEEELQTIIDSILRAKLQGGIKYKFFYSYNPPKRKGHWVNKKYESVLIPKNTYIHHSTYLNNPFLPEETLQEIESLKQRNLAKYEWNYLGKVTGGGIVPFENLVFRRITDEELKTFDNIRQGADWGYATDPLAFERHHYDKTRRRILFMDEIYGVKISNREFALKMKEKGYDSTVTIADSAEPKSIAECRDLGLKMKGAKKGEGSVEYGEKWLDDLEEIVIDPERTPNIAKEFENIDYEVDKDGNQKAKLEDKNNHSIDATRYGSEDDMKHSGVRFFNTN